MSTGPKRRARARVVRPTRRGLAVGIVGAVVVILAYAFGRTELLLVGWLAVLLFLAAVFFVSLRRVRMSVTRSFPSPTLIAGHATVGTLEIKNLSRYASAEAGWKDDLPWPPSAAPFERLRALPAASNTWDGSVVVVRYEFVPPRRGLFEIGPLIIELSDPFGLARSEVAIGETERFAVIPDVEKLSSGGVTAIADEGSARAMRYRALGGDDDVTTRSYRSGDALRRVHWRASAHRGELMVREEEQRSHAEARIVLDTMRSGYADFHLVPGPDEVQSERFEWALRITATLALHLEERGFLVQVVETGPRQIGQPEHVDGFLESVAAATLSPFPAPSARTVDRDTRPYQSLGVVFAIVADADEATLETLTTQRRGFEIAIALIVPRNAQDDGKLQGRGKGQRDEDFDTVAERLGAVGWLCVPAPLSDSVAPLWSTIAPLLERGHATH
ncbi:MAG: DUF58 domain-containing protein [Lacisediminihabitans sp.]